MATLLGIAATYGVPITRLGTTDGDRLRVKGTRGLTVEELRAAHTGTMPRYFAS